MVSKNNCGVNVNVNATMTSSATSKSKVLGDECVCELCGKKSEVKGVGVSKCFNPQVRESSLIVIVFNN